MNDGTRVICVRHGETEWNRAGRIQGQLDSPLTDAGRAAARRVGEALRDERPAAVWSSDLGRAWQTAERLVAGAGWDLVPIPQPGLRERGLGVLEGHTVADAQVTCPDELSAWHGAPEQGPTGGETCVAFSQRVMAVLEQAHADFPGQCVVMVVHGGVLGALFRQIVGLPSDARRSWSLSNAAINELQWQRDRWLIERWGDTAHLVEPQHVWTGPS